MKIWNSEHTFEHDWNTVVHAAWRKYPNPINPAVTGLDVLNRNVSNDGVMRTSRVLMTEWRFPGWVGRMIGLENPSYAYEYSEVDPTGRRMTLKSRNLNCTKFVSVDETLTYRPHPEDPSKTLLEQSAVIAVKGIPLVDYMENLMASTMSSNAHKGRQAMEWVIGKLKREYEDLSEIISHEYTEISQSAKRGMDELRHHLDDLGHRQKQEG